VRLSAWRADAAGDAALEKTLSIWVVDRHSRLGHLALDSSLFGEHSGQVVFGDLGAPTKIITGDKSGIGAIVDALASVPDSVTAGLDAATKAEASVSGLLDAGDERRLATLKRQLDIKTNDLNLKGLAATADDFAEQKRLEQEVAMAGSRTELETAELDAVKHKVDMVDTQTKLAQAQRDAQVDSDLADVHIQIAGLTARMDLAKLQAPAK